MLVHTDPNLQKAIILSFPRDLWVDIPGQGTDKINSAFEGGLTGGGPQLMAKTISNLTGLTIDHYLYVDLNGFQNVVNTLGGVELCIPAYNVNTPGWVEGSDANGNPTQIYYDEVGHIVDPNTGLDVVPGCQKLDGSQGLAYVRSRHLPCDTIPDFARIGRQQQFMRAVINQMLKPAQIAKARVGRARVGQPASRSGLPSRRPRLSGGTDARAQHRGCRVPSGAGCQRRRRALDRQDGSQRPADLPGDPGREAHHGSRHGARRHAAVGGQHDGGRHRRGGGDAAQQVEDTLTNAGFDITPGIVSGEAPKGVKGAAILYRPGDAAYADVVSKYFPACRSWRPRVCPRPWRSSCRPATTPPSPDRGRHRRGERVPHPTA